MKLFYLPNLASKTIKPLTVTPEQVIRSKRLKFPGNSLEEQKANFVLWSKDKDTEHKFISLAEGGCPTRRVDRENEPLWIHGLIGEYDAPVETDHLINLDHDLPQGFEGKIPNYVCHSFSGNARAFWEFEEPVHYPGREMWDAFATRLYERFMAGRILDGLQLEETLELFRYFDVGWSWTCLDQPSIKTSLLTREMEKAITDEHFNAEGLGVKLPLEAVHRFGKESKYKDDIDWNNLNFGDRCRRFWDAGDRDDAALCVPEGFVVFTPHDFGFKSWGSLFGFEKLQEFAEDAFAVAVKDIYYDTSKQAYWTDHSCTGWEPNTTDNTKMFLVTRRGMSKNRIQGEQYSQVDNSLIRIQETQAVKHVAYKFYDPNRIVTVAGKRVLNVSDVKLMQADPDPNPDGKKCPKLLAWFQGMFGKHLPYWLAHTRQFYQEALAGDLQPTLGMILAGPKDIGKTFMLNYVLIPIFGPGASGTRFLTGVDGFNGNLFKHPIIFLDDLVRGERFSTHNFTERLKSISSNEIQAVRAMRTDEFNTAWIGLLYLIMNRDDSSLSVFPNMDATTRDKYMILGLEPHKAYIPTKEEIKAELPFFCSYLRDSQHDKCIRGDRRFGIKPFHDPVLIAQVEANSPKIDVLELLDIFDKEYFQDTDTESTVRQRGWVDKTPRMLHAAMLELKSFEGKGSQALGVTQDQLKKAIVTLRDQNRIPWVVQRSVTWHRYPVYRIFKRNQQEQYPKEVV